jgi:adenylyltransferase/sulfurtransferase
MPGPASGPTCETAGIVAPIVQVIAGVQAGEALKILAGQTDALLPGLVSVDLWGGMFEVTDLRGRAPWCPACTAGRFDYATRAPSAVLCGREAVQLRPLAGGRIDLPALAARLQGVGEVLANPYLVRFRGSEGELVVFEDGRAIVKGVKDAAQARTLYAKYVGS